MAFMLAQEKRSPDFECSYDVFLSFRGEDTRYTFTGQLHKDLLTAGFNTFLDDDEIERGRKIKTELERAITESRISILVISKDYASSGWCLDELVLILQRHRSSDHIVLPVFYDVDPSDVRKQRGRVAEAFLRHEERCKTADEVDKIQKWRMALTEVADLAGMVYRSQADGYEWKFIEKIVRVVEDKLSRTLLSIDSHLVGIDSHVEKINFWIHDKTIDIGVLLICGIGGIGKTTTAKHVYNLNYSKFPYSSFLSNIREVSKETNGLVHLQRQLLSDILGKRVDKIHTVDIGIKLIRKTLKLKKVLLVLDDVDEMKQLDAILGLREWVYGGSRIIITTRRKDLLANSGRIRVHTIEKLSDQDSSELLSWHAFGQRYPKENYTEQFERFLSHCQGLPLALKVLGSSLAGKTPDVWTSQLRKLEEFPDKTILSTLRISYDSLQDDHDKNLFLDIACFFAGKKKDYTATILDGCGFYTSIGIENLMDRCLLTIDKNNKLLLHHLLQDMGKQIVREESNKYPEERSRLWRHQDSYTLLCDKSGTKNIEGLILDMKLLKKEASSLVSSYNVALETEAFEKMRCLRILCLNYAKLIGSFQVIPRRIRFLCLRGFLSKSIPYDFPLDNLVYLDMRNSSLEEIWKGNKVIESLKVINLSHSSKLAKIVGFSNFPNLEKLILKDCPRLIEFHKSISFLQRLNLLNLKDCKSLKRLPQNIHMVKSLEQIIISGCSSLVGVEEELKNMSFLKVLYADGIPIRQLLSTQQVDGSWMAFMCSLVSTNRRSPEIFSWTSLPRSLITMSLDGCNLSDDVFPKDFSNLSMLQHLSFGNNPFHNLPDCLNDLTQLKTLGLRFCQGLKQIHWPSINAEYLDVTGCHSLEKITQKMGCAPKRIEHGDCGKLNHVENGFKIKALKEINAEMISNMGFFNLDSIASTKVTLSNRIVWSRKKFPIKIIYECGVFSTFYRGREVPRWFTKRSSTSSKICLTVPLLPNLNLKIKGLNTCLVYQLFDNPKWIRDTPFFIQIDNKSTGHRMVYEPRVIGIPNNNNEAMVWLSHWVYGNFLEEGDELEVSFFMNDEGQIMECGVYILCDQNEQARSTLASSYLFFDGNFRIFLPGRARPQE